MKSYHGDLTAGKPIVHVLENGKPHSILDPEPSKRIRNHSPDGFNWGYGGSGPAQLALAILIDYFSHIKTERRPEAIPAADLALRLYQEFKFDVVAFMSQEWELDDGEIAMWITNREASKKYFKGKWDGAKPKAAAE